MNNGPLVRQISRRQWWLGASRYRRYLARELTALFIGAYAVMLIVGLWRLSEGADAFSGWLAAMQSPVGFVFNALIFVTAVYHSCTWFNVAPKAMVVRIGALKVPDLLISIAHYVAWAVASLVVFLLVRL